MTTFIRRHTNPIGTLTRLRTLHIQKAITDKEVPPKVKHVRAIIVATFEEQSSEFYYEFAMERSPSSNPVLCWKFLYILYKILRFGHPECIKDGIKNASKLLQLQSFWLDANTSTGYPLIDFFRLIIGRLKLHRKYTILPGTLEPAIRERTTALQALPDHLFQFSIDLMDFLEEILRFYRAVLPANDAERRRTYTAASNCKMIPLLLCLQDAAAVYDLIVHILFKLHERLQQEVLAGHRQRFTYLHNQLVEFFQVASRIHYFKDFVQIPALPKDPPNFYVRADLVRHTSYRISVEEAQSSEDEVESATDSAPTTVHMSDPTSLSASNNLPTNLINNPTNRDLLNSSLEADIIAVRQIPVNDSPHASPHNNNHHNGPSTHAERTEESHEFLLETELLKSELAHVKDEHEQVVHSLVKRIETLEHEIQNVVQQKTAQDEQFEQLGVTARANADRANTFGEKFFKLKEAYSKLHTEHVIVLRELSATQRMLAELEDTNKELNERIKSGGDKQDSSIHANKPFENTECRAQLFSLLCFCAVDELRSLSNELYGCEAVTQEQHSEAKRLCTFIMEDAIKEANELSSVLGETGGTASDEVFLRAFHLTSRLYATLLQQRLLSVQHGSEDVKAAGSKLLTAAIQMFHQMGTDSMAATSLVPNVSLYLEQMHSSLCGSPFLTQSPNDGEDTQWFSLLEQEMLETTKHMIEAEEKFKQLLAKSSSCAAGPLRVHQSILNQCVNLIAAVGELVAKAKEAQQTLQNDNDNSQNYKRQGNWTQGCLSAAKSVGACANVLIEVADQLVSGREHVLERLLVVSQEISASTTQLQVASRVKLHPNSIHLNELQKAIRTVSQRTGDLVGDVKAAIENQRACELDFSGLTPTQTKRMQVESQIRVLKLEKALEDERSHLSQLRKHNYRDEAEFEDQTAS